jgi:hypothetical protein
MLELCYGQNFTAEPFCGHAHGEVGRQNFYNDLAVQLAILGEVNARHPSAHELALERVLIAQLGEEVFGDGLHAFYFSLDLTTRALKWLSVRSV